MVNFGFARKKTTETHRNRTRNDFSNACRQYNMRVRHRPAQTCGEGKRHCQTIAHADNDVGQKFRTLKMRLVVVVRVVAGFVVQVRIHIL